MFPDKYSNCLIYFAKKSVHKNYFANCAFGGWTHSAFLFILDLANFNRFLFNQELSR